MGAVYSILLRARSRHLCRSTLASRATPERHIGSRALSDPGAGATEYGFCPQPIGVTPWGATLAR
ncbi:MAG: hypothetical protein NVS4B3_19740 [Gemmatimonadaceae bacterium]